jgi:hypothetical protein
MHDPNTRRLWLTLGMFTLLCVPYPFVGKAEPLVFGLPLWFWVTITASVALVVVTIRALRRWNLSALDSTPEARDE